MAAGTTTSGSAADSLNVIIDSATLVREYVGSYSRTVTMERLPVGTGLSWDEVSTAQLTAQSITETTELNNPQQFVDSILSLTPTQCGIMTRVTKKAKHRLSPKVLATWGSGAQKAMDRYKNDQYLALLDTATVSQPGAASTLSQGVIGAMARQITSNTTAPATSAIYTVLHGFQIHDVESEVLSGIGTYTIPSGMTEETFKRGFKGMCRGTTVYEDGNITIDGSDDAKGGVHAKEAVLCVQGMAPVGYTKFNESYGGGADEFYLYDDFIFGERHAGGGSSGGGWLKEIYSDALAPTA